MAIDARAQFIKDLDKHKKIAAKSMKKPASSGRMDDTEVIELLGLTEGVKKIVSARLARVYYGVSKTAAKQQFFQFRFAILDSKYRGVPVSIYRGLDLSSTEKEEQSFDFLYGEFQRLGIDTTEWDGSSVGLSTVEAAEQLSEDKPYVTIALSVYQKRDAKGKPSGDPRLNINIMSLSDAPTSSVEDEEAEQEQEEEEEYEEVEAEEAEDTSEEVEQEESDGEEESWIGYPCSFESEGETIEGVTSAYDADSDTYTVTVSEYGEDWDGDYEVTSAEITWAEEA